MTFDVYVPRPGYSVRPPDLPQALRETLRPDVPPAVVEEHRPPAAGPPAAGRRWLRRLVEIPVLLAGALLLAFVIKTFLVQAFFIPSGSMTPALEIGDRVLVEKVTYRFREPQRGEIVVFERSGVDAGEGVRATVRSFFEGLGVVPPSEEIALIKRVLGLPGETVEVRAGTVVVDGRPLDEDYALPDGQSFSAVTLPDGGYYLLGDNRSNSDDSRYSLGAVQRGDVVGRAFLILWPPGNASLSLRTHYAGDHPPTDDGRRAPAITPPALPRTDDAPEAPPP